MAKARAIFRRRKAVTNTRKITRTMQLIATSKFQQSLSQAMATKPFTTKITELVAKLSDAAGDEELSHPLLRHNEDTGRRVLLALTSNRGLCGGYNASLLRTMKARIGENKQKNLESELHLVGQKGIAYCTFLGLEMASINTAIGESPTFEDVERIANQFMADYEDEKIDGVDVVYMKFFSAGKQVPTCAQLLPIEHEPSEDAVEETGSQHAQYDFSPEPAELLGELLPMTVKTRLFQFFMDAVVSENVARMVAMKSATDAATDMIRNLSQQYNRARQSQITMELLDIVGGANALD